MKTVDELITGNLKSNPSPNINPNYSKQPLKDQLDLRDYTSVVICKPNNCSLVFPKLQSDMESYAPFNITKTSLYNSETRRLQTNFDYLNNHGRIAELDKQH